MSDDDDASVLVFRDKSGTPVAVPKEVVAEAERPYKAYLARREGQPWSRIAQDNGYLNAEAAQYDVRAYMATGRALVQDAQRKELLAFEVARLDALQQAIWQRAMNGDLPAVNTSIQLIMNRAKLLRLDDETLDESSSGPRTVVVQSGDEQYRAELERAADGV